MIITISITLLSIECLSSKITSTNSDIWEPPFKGLQWSMSEAEVMNILKLTENDVIKDSISFITKNECDILGFKKMLNLYLERMML